MALALVLGTPAGPCSAQQSEKSAARASQAFAAASQLFERDEFAAAIIQFRKAYSLKPHYSVRCNIALCHERLGDYVAAESEYEACLAQGATSTPRRASIQKTLNEVAARIGRVKVRSRSGGVVFVDGQSAGAAPQSLSLNPGRRTVEVRREGARSARTTIVIHGGEHLTVDLDPVELSVGADDDGSSGDGEPGEPDDASAASAASADDGDRARGISQAWFWTAAGATVALAVTSIVLGLQTLELKSEFEDDPTRPRYDSGVARRLATNIALATAIAAGASAAVLFFYTDFGGKRGDDETATIGVGVRGTF